MNTLVTGIVKVEVLDDEVKRIAIRRLKQLIDVNPEGEFVINGNCDLYEQQINRVPANVYIRKASELDIAVVLTIKALNKE
jgi:hypothetical protein